MKIWAILGGGDWADASVRLVATETDVDMSVLWGKYREWYLKWDRKKEEYLSFADWLLKNDKARRPTEEEAGEYNEYE